MSRVSVIGAGYAGLTSAAVLAHLGHEVCCADILPEKVAALSRGEIPILETGLGPLVQEGLRRGRLRFIVGAAAAAAQHEFVLLCLPTPGRPDGSADLSYVMRVAAEIGPVLSRGSIVVNRSTVPIGSAPAIATALRRPDIALVSNPEFLREGSALQDCMAPDRIVIGSADQTAATRVAGLFIGVGAPVVMTSHAGAEAIKYAANAFLATRLSFINMVANVCEAVGAEVDDVIAGMAYDRRIGPAVLRPGPGWGGSCLPKDTRALIHTCEQAGTSPALLRGVCAVNEAQHQRVVTKIATMAGGSLETVTVAVWGLAFKAGTNDLRQSPALAIIKLLNQAGARVRAYDPTVRQPLPGLEVCAEPYEACRGAVVLAVLTEWEEFRSLDFGKVRQLIARPCVVDARNVLDPAVVRAAGFSYQGTGRG